jgi:anti-anti-sigma factor
MGDSGFSILIGKPVGGLAVVEVAGELDSFTTPAFRACVDQVLNDGASRLLVDFTGLAFIDSAGLGDLIAAAHRAARQAVGLVVVCPPGESRGSSRPRTRRAF